MSQPAHRVSTGLAALFLGSLAQLVAGCSDGGSHASSGSDAKAAERAACAFATGAAPADTLGPEIPQGDAIPLDHILVLMQENRSFDHYFGRLPAAGHLDVDGLPDDASNPDASGNAVPAFHTQHYCIDDVNHEWSGSHLEYDDGLNDGFVTQNDPQGERAMGYLDQTDLPFYYGLASTFAIADRYFCAVLGPTFPNRYYLLAATSDGRITNRIAAFTRTTIFDRLDQAGIKWKIYATPVAFAALLGQSFVPIEEFYADAAVGSLPQVAFIDPIFSGADENDEHPPANPQVGQRFIKQVYDALTASPNWSSSALFITYDEHGGFYDHVPPPSACPPDAVPPELEPGDFAAGFDRHGFRVPLIAVSPYARKGFVSHEVYDHTSILRLIEARYGLPALTARDANATPLTAMFDFTHVQFPSAPSFAEPPLDPAQLEECKAFGFNDQL